VKFAFWVGIYGGIASIVGLVVYIIPSEPWKIWTATGAVILGTGILFTKTYRLLSKISRTAYPNGFLKLATTNIYRCIDGKEVVFESLRLIQCKRAFLITIDHPFRWTGSKGPRVKSDHNTINIVLRGTEEQYSTAKITLERPLLYNEVGLVHVLMHMDDSDQSSDPVMAVRVDEPLNVLEMRAELGAARTVADTAQLETRPIEDGGIYVPWKPVETIRYDSASLYYLVRLIRPRPGYIYRLRWSRKAQTG